MIITWNPQDLCVSAKPREKVILLDKSVQWAQRYKLVAGQRYQLSNVKLKELDKVTIVTSATFRNVGDYPSFIDSIFPEVRWYATLPLKLTFLRRVWMDGDSIISEERLEGLEIVVDLNLPISEEFSPAIRSQLLKFQEYHVFLKRNGLVHAESINERHRDYTVGYRKKGEAILGAIFNGFGGGWVISVLTGTEQVWEAVTINGESLPDVKKFTSKEFVKIADAVMRPELGVTFLPLIETGMFTKGTVNVGNDSQNGYIIHENAEPTEMLLEWLYEINRLVPPNKVLSQTQKAYVDAGRRVAFACESWEFNIGGWDGTNYWCEELPVRLPLLEEDNGECIIVLDGDGVYFFDCPGTPKYTLEVMDAAAKQAAVASLKHIYFPEERAITKSGNFLIGNVENDLPILSWRTWGGVSQASTEKGWIEPSAWVISNGRWYARP